MDDTTTDASASSASSASTPPPARPPLRRSRSDRKLFGVAGGLARYFGIDPLLVRIAFVVLAISGAGAGVLLYLACAALVPGEAVAPGAPAAPGSQDRHPAGTAFVDRHGKALAIIGAIIALSALLSSSGPFGWGDHDNGVWGLLWVGLLVTIIVLVAMEVQARREARAATSQPGTPGSATGPGEPAAQAWPAQPLEPVEPRPWQAQAYVVPPAPPSPEPLAPPEPPSGLGGITFGLALLVAGTLVGLDRAGTIDASAVVVLGSALAVVGCGLLVGAFLGSARWLISIGVVLALATGTAAVDRPGNGQVGEVEWQPTSVAEVEATHEWGIGDVMLDLTTMADLADATTDPAVSTSVEMAVGSLTVLVPTDVEVEIDAHVGLGNIVGVKADDVGGFGRDASATLPALPTKKDAAAEPAPTIDLDLRVGVGEVRVTRVSS